MRCPSQGAAASRRRPRTTFALATAALVPALALGCGDTGREADGAYITTAIRHHEAAIAIASLAREARVGRRVRRLGRQLERRHAAAIEPLEQAHRRMFDAEVPANPTHGSLGLTDAQLGLPPDTYTIAGRRLSERGLAALVEAHHEGAIRLAEAELGEGGDERLKQLARATADESRRELRVLYRATR